MSPTTDAIDTQPTIETLHTTLTTQAQTLLSELSAFRKYLDDHPSTTPVKSSTLLGKFQIDVQRELNHLLKYSTDVHKENEHSTTTESNAEARSHEAENLDGIHRIRSSNITFLSDVWEGAKRREGVIGIRKGVKYVPVRTATPDSIVEDQAVVIGQVDTNGGVKGVSKKMNREARERAKLERKMRRGNQSQGQSLSEIYSEIQGKEATGTVDGVNGDDHGAVKVQAPTTTETTENGNEGPKRNRTIVPKPNGNMADVHPRVAKESVTVDIIADHGATWIKMFTKNQRWLMMDLAKEGIVDIDDDDDDESSTCTSDSENDERIPSRGTGAMKGKLDEAMEELKLVKMGREFLAASRSVRVGSGHRHPKVVFCLSKVERGVSRDADRVLEYLGSTGVEVVTADELGGAERANTVHSNTNRNKTSEGGVKEYDFGMSEVFRTMASVLPPVPITETLNVDCTVLIALISDISHSRRSDITIPEHYKGSARRDIEIQLQTDVEDALLPDHIYPILRDRKLVCTRKATEHWKNIVRIMGSPSEAARCRILLGEVGDDTQQDFAFRERLQKLSVHDVPHNLRLPLKVMDFDLDDMDINQAVCNCSQVEIDVMKKLAKEPRLSSLNSSVFFHGWYRGLTTISLNRVISEWLNRAINVVLDDLELRKGMTSDIAEVMGFNGTIPLVCGRERSLLGSEK